MPVEQTVEELLDEGCSLLPRDLGPAEAVHLVAVEADRAILAHDLGVAPGRRRAGVVGVVLAAVNLDDEPRAICQEEEVHPLPWQLLARETRELALRVWLVVEVDLRDERGHLLIALAAVPLAERLEEEPLGRAGH